MTRLLFLSSVCAGALAIAQEPPAVVKPGQGAKLAVPAVTGDKPKARKPREPGGPTVIVSREAVFRNSTQTAEFKFEVTVEGPDLRISCDKLKIVMEQPPAASSPGDQPKQVAPADQPVAKDAPISNAMGGNIKEAIAEGNVIITQTKPGKGGEPPTRYLAKGKKAIFNGAKQSLTLSGWPQVIETIDGKPTKQTNALEEKTIVILFQSNDMQIDGMSEVIIHEKKP